MSNERDPYWDYDEQECWNCGGDGYVYGCSWDWQCDTYDEGEGTCLCTRRCHICQPQPSPDPALLEVLRNALASVDTHPQGGDATEIAAPFMSGAAGEAGTPKGTSHAD